MVFSYITNTGHYYSRDDADYRVIRYDPRQDKRYSAKI